STGLWTLPRVALMIKRVTGIKYHPGHVWRLLGALDWTLQRPAKRAKERNEPAIRHRVTTRWPAAKKTPGGAGPGPTSKHKTGAMTAYLQTQRSWLTVERLPGYAPDLNPTELVWGNVKGQELANLCADNLGEVERAVRTGLRRVRRAPTLAFAFLRHAGLSF